MEKDVEEAAELYQQSAEQGHADAQNNLGICYYNGIGVERDVEKAAELYQRLAGQEHADTQNNPVCYQNGIGVEKDRLYQKTVKQRYS